MSLSFPCYMRCISEDIGAVVSTTEISSFKASCQWQFFLYHSNVIEISCDNCKFYSWHNSSDLTCAKICSNQITGIKLHHTEISSEFQTGVKIFSEMGPISMLWSTKEMQLECLISWNIAIFAPCHYLLLPLNMIVKFCRYLHVQNCLVLL